MSEWQPIETAPKDGRFLILCVPFTIGYPYITMGRFATNMHEWGISAGCGSGILYDSSKQPTHWMPLPEPPTTSPVIEAKGE